ncbi:MAG: GNAT family N-acetyltransferase [Clostridia bacterium]|nr:GNAT family N-acetyltransferase [Clostridia bacterium]
MMPYIRPAEDKDLKNIEYICRMTAGPEARKREDVGKKIALTYSTYYARAEQETSFVLDDEGKAVGYILCAPDFTRYIKDYRKNEVKKLWGIEKKQSIIAYFLPLGYLPFKNKYPAHLHIDLLDEYQGKGYGSQMMKTLLAKLKEMKLPGVMLIVDKDNEGAQRFYKRAGFRKIASAFGGVVMARKL